MNIQNSYMRHAIELADRAVGRTSPNPFVGAVIVKNGYIIGEGHTQPCGQDHAEIVALKEAGKKARGADMYVTLEPCSHWGRTPPCTDAIIRAGIKRVLIGIPDPNPKVCNLSEDILQKSGIEVTTGIEADAVRKQLRPYLHAMEKKRPFVTLKIASSLDGCIAAEDGSSRWITGKASREYVHHMRNRSDAILTGVGTVLTDDPMLNVRLEGECSNPVRVILDRELKTLRDAKIVASAHQQPTWIFTEENLHNADKARLLRDQGVEVISVASDADGLLIEDVLKLLHDRGIMLVMVEAGPRLVTTMIRRCLADRLVIFYGNTLLGGTRNFIHQPLVENIENARRWEIETVRMIGEDVVMEINFPQRTL